MTGGFFETLSIRTEHLKSNMKMQFKNRRYFCIKSKLIECGMEEN